MAKLNVVEDVGVPVGVGGAQYAMRKWDEKRATAAVAGTTVMEFEPIVAGALVALGVAGVMTSRYQNYAKPLLHASLPRGTNVVIGYLNDLMAGEPAPAAGIRRSSQVGAASIPRRITAGAGARVHQPQAGLYQTQSGLQVKGA